MTMLTWIINRHPTQHAGESSQIIVTRALSVHILLIMAIG